MFNETFVVRFAFICLDLCIYIVNTFSIVASKCLCKTSFWSNKDFVNQESLKIKTLDITGYFFFSVYGKITQSHHRPACPVIYCCHVFKKECKRLCKCIDFVFIHTDVII